MVRFKFKPESELRMEGGRGEQIENEEKTRVVWCGPILRNIVSLSDTMGHYVTVQIFC